MTERTSAAGVAFMGPGDEFLFLRRSSRAGDHQGTWSWPGGGIETGETPEQAASREVQEEIGYEIDPETLGKVASVYGGYNTYTFPVQETFVPALLGNEHVDYVWARREEAPQPLHPGVVEMLFFNLAAARDGAGDPDLTQGDLPLREEVGDQDTRDTFTADGSYFAPIALGKKRRLMPDGTLLIEDCGLARTGTMLYTKKDLPKLEADSNGLITVERSEEEVFHPEAMASFNGIAVTLYHPPEFVKPHNWKQYSVGHIQNPRRGIGPDSDLLKGDIIIKDAAAIQHANLKLPDISCGYDTEYKQLAPGRASQHKIRGNHAAMVDKGRAGRRCAITDEDTTIPLTGVHHMKTDFWARASAYLKGKGLGARDISELQTMDQDATAGATPPSVIEQPTLDTATPAWARNLFTTVDAIAKQVAAATAWQKAFDEACKADKDEKEQAVKDQAAKDAEKEEARKKYDDSEKTGDVLLSAEDGPEVFSLGKTWNGLTGDQAITEVNSLAEAMVPGVAKVTHQQLAGSRGAVLANHMRDVLTRRATVDADSVTPFIMDGTPIAKLSGLRLAGVFRGAGNNAKIRNNANARAIAAPGREPTNDSLPVRQGKAVASFKERMEKYADERAKAGNPA